MRTLLNTVLCVMRGAHGVCLSYVKMPIVCAILLILAVCQTVMGRQGAIVFVEHPRPHKKQDISMEEK